MLEGSKVLLVCGDGETGQRIASAFALLKAQVEGPVLPGAQAFAELDRARPDALVVELGCGEAGLVPLIERVLSEGIPTVVCADPDLLPAFRGRHPTLSVIPGPCRPLRLIGEVAVLLAG